VIEISPKVVYNYWQEVIAMPNAELLIKEIQSLPLAYMEEALNFIGYLKQKASVSHAAAPFPETAECPANDNPNISPAWKLFGRSRPPTMEELDDAFKRGCGIAKDSSLTVDRFLELRNEDLEIEEAQYQNRFHMSGTKA
jgi:hypothetical protein